MTAAVQKNKHIDLLDHARGVAIIGVLLCHTLSSVYGYDFIHWDGWFRDFSKATAAACLFFPLSAGNAGVALFFVISGFCIHLSFQQQRPAWGTFFIRRFFRIYPAYIAALILFVLLNSIGDYFAVFKSSHDAQHLLAHVFLVHNISPDMIGTINGSFWSLAIEVQLYLLYPLFLGLIAKFGWGRGLGLLAGVEVALQAAKGLWGDVPGSTGIITNTLAISPLGYWFSWALGALVAERFMKKQTMPWATVSPWWWIGLAAATYLVRPLSPFWFTASAVASAAVLGKLLTGSWQTFKFQGAVFVPLKNMGIWSYSIYLLHQPLLIIYLYSIDWLVPIAQRSMETELFVVFVTWVAIIPVAWLWFLCFELPGVAAGKKLLQRMGMRSGASAKPLPPVTAGFIRKTVLTGILLAAIAGTFTVKKTFSKKSPDESNNLAWKLATSADPESRNGTLAVIYAESACSQTGYRVIVMVGTLGAAYAEAGRFEEAIATAKAACLMAEQAGDQGLLERNRELLGFYERHQAYHQ